MAPLINIIGYLITGLDSINKKNINLKISEFNKEKIERESALESNFRNFLNENYHEGLKIMLISYSSTIINQLIKNKDFGMEFYVLESRPLFEGRRTVQILSEHFSARQYHLYPP